MLCTKKWIPAYPWGGGGTCPCAPPPTHTARPLVQWTQQGQKHIFLHQNQPSMSYILKWPLDHVVAIVVGIGVPWSGPWPCCWYCCWCWWTSDGSETCSNEVSMVKNIYLGTKIILLLCQGDELHLQVDLDLLIGIVFGVCEHLLVLKPFPIDSAWSKTNMNLIDTMPNILKNLHISNLKASHSVSGSLEGGGGLSS